MQHGLETYKTWLDAESEEEVCGNLCTILSLHAGMCIDTMSVLIVKISLNPYAAGG